MRQIILTKGTILYLEATAREQMGNMYRSHMVTVIEVFRNK